MRSWPSLIQQELANHIASLGAHIDRAGIAKIEIGLRRVCDFEVLVLATKDAIKVDQASAMRGLFSEINRLRPAAIQTRDGHSCWLFNQETQQGTGQAWIDRETLFPVVVQGTTGTGVRNEIHYQLLKSDFNVTITLLAPTHCQTVPGHRPAPHESIPARCSARPFQ